MKFPTKYAPHYHYFFFSMLKNYFCIVIWIWCYYLTVLTYNKLYTRFRHFLAITVAEMEV